MDIQRPKWLESTLDLEMELTVTVNWKSNEENTYLDVFLSGDENGQCNIADYLSEEEKAHIIDCVTDAFDEMRREMDGK